MRGLLTGNVNKTLLLLVLCLAVVSFGFYFGPQMVVYFELRRMTMPPGLLSDLKPLKDATTSKAAGTTVTTFGCRFEVPWAEIEQQQNEGRWVRVHFKSGQDIVFLNPAVSQGEVLVGREPSVFHAAFRTGVAISKYDQFFNMVSITPSRLTPFLSHSDFAKRRIYLENKATYLEHLGGVDIFDIRTANYKGFEIRNISQDRVAVILFDARDRKFQIEMSVSPGSNRHFDQSEINRIIYSFSQAQSADS
jgi:hypothetical protein